METINIKYLKDHFTIKKPKLYAIWTYANVASDKLGVAFRNAFLFCVSI